MAREKSDVAREMLDMAKIMLDEKYLWPNKIGYGEINFGKTIKNHGQTKLNDRDFGKKIGQNENSPKALMGKFSKIKNNLP